MSAHMSNAPRLSALLTESTIGCRMLDFIIYANKRCNISPV
jgi:hypothetical protein